MRKREKRERREERGREGERERMIYLYLVRLGEYLSQNISYWPVSCLKKFFFSLLVNSSFLYNLMWFKKKKCRTRNQGNWVSRFILSWSAFNSIHIVSLPCSSETSWVSVCNNCCPNGAKALAKEWGILRLVLTSSWLGLDPPLWIYFLSIQRKPQW